MPTINEINLLKSSKRVDIEIVFATSSGEEYVWAEILTDGADPTVSSFQSAMARFFSEVKRAESRENPSATR